MRPNASPASAVRLRQYSQLLREMAPEASDDASRLALLELAQEFDEIAVAREGAAAARLVSE
jgi:hypothetical protein